MNAKQLRQILKGVYPNSAKWAIKVDKMTDAQVVAIYLNMRGKGKVA